MKSIGTTRMASFAVAIALVAWMATDASAFSRGRFGSGGSYGSASAGSYASSGSYGSASAGSYSTSYYASSGSYGSASSGSYGSASSGRQGLFARWHARKEARRAARASSGSYGSAGSYASYGSAGSYAVSYAPVSYASSGSYGASYSTPVYSAPVEYHAPVEAECATCSTSTSDVGTIYASVPEDAKIFVNDSLTTSTGSERTFASSGLKAGKSYAYDFRIVYTVDGEEVVREKTIQLQAGQDVRLSLDGDTPVVAKAEPVKTELTLAVPADAKVFLAGAETRQTGETRTFASTRLKSGQTWEDYTVRVVLERDGQTLVKEKSMNLAGGESYELSFDFDETANQLALAD
ncbi:MAG: TIGR03000 domain-containing protein [Lacipirellulaceae bacterium]